MLELDDLHRRFGDVKALDGMTFAVPPRTMFGFLGPNGAGKTTAMRAMLGVTALDAGSIRFDGRELDESMRRRFGYMPEERGLYPSMRVLDQLEYFGRLHGMDGPSARRAGDELCTRLGLTGRSDSKVEELSLGNQQRVQLAAALVHDPELLVLDEPFSGLDPVASMTCRTRSPSGRPPARPCCSQATSSTSSSISARRWRSSTTAAWSRRDRSQSSRMAARRG
ncbi:MAG TPA: ATP-binding cassette domain-containing protein [Solirubrobacteraceae bacterium]|nr:ATP-binding cassette domain-containing protein [Solirubrobacteraceae bacterium]